MSLSNVFSPDRRKQNKMGFHGVKGGTFGIKPGRKSVESEKYKRYQEMKNKGLLPANKKGGRPKRKRGQLSPMREPSGAVDESKKDDEIVNSKKIDKIVDEKKCFKQFTWKQDKRFLELLLIGIMWGGIQEAMLEEG